MAILCNLVFRSEIYNSIVSVNTLVDFIRPIQGQGFFICHIIVIQGIIRSEM